MLKRTSFHSAESHPVLLEAEFHAWEGMDRRPAAVVCHPHPLGGGTMHNGVVVTIARALAARGVAALRFNFRGVGASGGQHDDGHGERLDLLGALDWLVAQPEVDPEHISLVGYSFGASISLACAIGEPRVTAVAAVSFVAEAFGVEALRSLTQPKLFVVGQEDQLTSPQRLSQLVGELPPPKELRLVAGADHFWYGAERQVADVVAGFVAGP